MSPNPPGIACLRDPSNIRPPEVPPLLINHAFSFHLHEKDNTFFYPLSLLPSYILIPRRNVKVKKMKKVNLLRVWSNTVTSGRLCSILCVVLTHLWYSHLICKSLYHTSVHINRYFQHIFLQNLKPILSVYLLYVLWAKPVQLLPKFSTDSTSKPHTLPWVMTFFFLTVALKTFFLMPAPEL